MESRLLLAVYFCGISLRANKYSPEERTVKITKPLSVIINLSPLIGIVIFAVLFAFVLKGRLAKRATHAFLVFAIWIYATKFYQYILTYYKKKEILMKLFTKQKRGDPCLFSVLLFYKTSIADFNSMDDTPFGFDTTTHTSR